MFPAAHTRRKNNDGFDGKSDLIIRREEIVEKPGNHGYL
jgi:hypothetical protein